MRLADDYADACFDQGLNKRTLDDKPEDAREKLKNAINLQHTRILELEASQAQRVPLSADEVKEPKNGKAWRVEWWNESMRMMLPSDMVLHRFVSYQNGTMQFTLKKLVHGITQEKQG